MWTNKENDRKPEHLSAEYRNKHLRIYVTNGHLDHRPEWIMHCENVGFSSFRIPNTTPESSLEDAKREAMATVKHRLYALLASLD